MLQKKRMKNFLNLNYNKIFKNFDNKEDMYVIPVFIPHLGCKNECIFCNQRKISGFKDKANRDSIIENIEKYLNSFKKDKKIEVAFFGGSFTGLEKNVQIEYLEIVNEYIIKGKVNGIRLSTRPDYISEDILDLLTKYNVKTIELGIQSMDDEVLLISKRGHNKNQVIEAINLINKYDFNLGIQIMIGLPKSTVEKEIYTIKELLKYNPKYLRIYPLYVIENTELYRMYNNKEYIPLDFEDSLKRCIKIIECIKDSNLIVIRLGLQSSENISKDKVKGPVCDNYCEYVKSKMIKDYIEKYIINNNITEGELLIENNKYTSIIIGPNKINKIYFKDKYNIDLKVGIK